MSAQSELCEFQKIVSIGRAILYNHLGKYIHVHGLKRRFRMAQTNTLSLSNINPYCPKPKWYRLYWYLLGGMCPNIHWGLRYACRVKWMSRKPPIQADQQLSVLRIINHFHMPLTPRFENLADRLFSITQSKYIDSFIRHICIFDHYVSFCVLLETMETDTF